MPVSFEQFRDQCDQLAGALVRPDKDLWMRTTLYVVAGHWGEGTHANLVITGFHQPKQLPTPLSLAVSHWRRTADDQMPTAREELGQLRRSPGWRASTRIVAGATTPSCSTRTAASPRRPERA